MIIANIGGKGISEELGSAEEYVLQHATHQARLGHQVTVYGTEDFVHDRLNGIELVHFRSPFTGWLHDVLNSIASVLHACVWTRADVIHIHQSTTGIIAPLVRIMRPSASIFMTLHDMETHHAKGFFKRLVVDFGEKMGVKFSNQIFCTKRVIENYVSLQYGEKAQYVSHGVGARRVATNNVILNPLGLNSYNYIAMIAPLGEESGVFTLIDAWKKARAERPDVFKKLKLAIVRTQVDGINIEGHIDHSIVDTGFQNREVLQALYAGARFTVLPSFYSAQPATILTAMSYGKAVIASSLGEYSTIVKDNAVLFETGNADELAMCILKLAEDQMLAASLGHNARAFIEEEYRWDVLAGEMVDEYKKYRALRDGLLAIR